MLSHAWVKVIVVSVVIGTLATPALADDLGAFGSLAGPSLASHPAGTGPGEPVITPEMIAQAQIEQRHAADRKRERLASKQSRDERKASRTAHRRATGRQAAVLLDDRFGVALSRLGADPAALLRGLDVREYRGDHSALVDTPQGKQLAYSTFPLRTTNREGKKAPVDLSLRADNEAFRPVNPLVDARIPKRLGDGIAVGSHGIKVFLDGAEGALGADNGRRVLFHEAATDTDFIVGAIPTGIETFTQLRSPDSPVEQTLRFTLPAGAELHHTQDGGAEITSGDVKLMRIHAPSAVDAQGQAVPVTYTVEGHALKLHVDHRDGDFAYPILVDPIYEDWMTSCHGTPPPGQSDLGTCNYNQSWWHGANTPAMAQWYSTYGGAQFAFNTTGGAHGSFGSGYGLYVTAYAVSRYPANSYGQWLWKIADGNSAFIPRAEFGWQTLDRQGDWNNNAQIWNGIYSPTYGYTARTVLDPYWSGVPVANTYSTNIAANVTNKYAVFAMVMPDQRDRWYYTTAYLGGAIIVLDDPDNPTLSQATYSGIPAGWFDPTQTPATTSVTATASDPGVGIKGFKVHVPKPGGTDVYTNDLGCVGTKESSCPWGTAVSRTLSFNINNAPDGAHTVSTFAYDALGKNSALGNATIRVDRAAPDTPTLSGALHDHRDQTNDHRNEGLYAASYALTISAADAGSGVKTLDVAIDGSPVASLDRSAQCSSSGCPTTYTANWTLNTDSLSDGTHTFSVTAVDQLGHRSPAASFTAYVDRRGDIYHARTHVDGNPGTAPAETEQWGQLATRAARQEVYGEITTRDNVSCSLSPSGCAEWRDRVVGDAEGDGTFTSYRGSSPTDPSIHEGAQMMETLDATSADATSSGNLRDALQPWQIAPPAHGSTYWAFETTESVPNHRNTPSGDETSEENGPSATTTTMSIRTTLYVDSATKLPVKQTHTNLSNGSTSTTYYTYDKGRDERSSYPSDFFVVDQPGSVSEEKQVQFYGTGSPGPRTDADSGQQFRAYGLGNSFSLGNVTYCLATSYSVEEREPVIDSITSTSPELTGGFTAPISSFAVAYTGLGSGESCVPGNASLATPDVFVRSASSTSRLAAAWRDIYRTQGEAVQTDPLHEDSLRGGIAPVAFGGGTSTAYVIRIDDTRSGALIERDGTSLIVIGPFDKLSLSTLATLLEIR